MTDGSDMVVMLRRALEGNVEALARMGACVLDPPVWRRVQRVVAPRRYRLWVQRQVLAAVEQGS